MKAMILSALVLLCACKKEETKPDQPALPITRQMFADFTTADTSAMRVVISRATQDHVPYEWHNVSGHIFELVTRTGDKGNVYRNDHVYFYSNATGSATIPVRIDEVQSFNVDVDPAMNGQVVYQTVTDW